MSSSLLTLDETEKFRKPKKIWKINRNGEQRGNKIG